MVTERDEWRFHMKRGDYAQAWRVSEQVLAARDRDARDNPRLPYHLRWVWDGRDFANRHVLVRCYHGLGDTLQFARYLPLLGTMAASVTVEAQPQLIPILSTLDGVGRFIPFILDAPAPPSDCDMEIMELQFALRAPPDAIDTPYFHSSPLQLTPGAIGLCWHAGEWDPDRRIPHELFRALTFLPCVSLIPEPTDLRVLNPEGCPRDIESAARLVASVDLVITVDTMIAHLAGALGRPVWLLLKHDADWRWMADRNNSPWYPSMRLYRQPEPGDWSSVLARVAEDVFERR